LIFRVRNHRVLSKAPEIKPAVAGIVAELRDCIASLVQTDGEPIRQSDGQPSAVELDVAIGQWGKRGSPWAGKYRIQVGQRARIDGLERVAHERDEIWEIGITSQNAALLTSWPNIIKGRRTGVYRHGILDAAGEQEGVRMTVQCLCLLLRHGGWAKH